MTDDRSTDRATPVPLAAPLTGEPPEPDQPTPAQVFAGGEPTELDHLVSDEDA